MQRISIDLLFKDTTTQARVETNQETVGQYADAMREDRAKFGPPVVFVGKDHVFRVGDGWHRISAAKRIGDTEIDVDLRDGDARDALSFNIIANAQHGLNFSRADKRRIVGLMLDDPEWSSLTDREIARRCGVSHPFVSEQRKLHEASARPDPRPIVADWTPEKDRKLAEAESRLQSSMPAIKRALENTGELESLLGTDRFEARIVANFGTRYLADYRQICEWLDEAATAAV